MAQCVKAVFAKSEDDWVRSTRPTDWKERTAAAACKPNSKSACPVSTELPSSHMLTQNNIVGVENSSRKWHIMEDSPLPAEILNTGNGDQRFLSALNSVAPESQVTLPFWNQTFITSGTGAEGDAEAVKLISWPHLQDSGTLVGEVNLHF